MMGSEYLSPSLFLLLCCHYPVNVFGRPVKGEEDKTTSNKIPKRKISLEGGGDSGGDDHSKKKKKTRSDGNGEVYGAKKSSKSLNEVYSNGVHSVSEEITRSFGNTGSTNNGGLDRKLNSFSLSSDNIVQIPRSKCGSVHTRKFNGIIHIWRRGSSSSTQQRSSDDVTPITPSNLTNNAENVFDEMSARSCWC